MKAGLVCVAATFACLVPVAAEAVSKPPFGTGQVWAYDARPGDETSVLRINRIDKADTGFVIHISVVGIHWCGHPTASTVNHVAVSSTALRQSVTHIATTRLNFPEKAEVDAALKRWDDSQAGYMTEPLREIFASFDETTCINRWDDEGKIIEPTKPIKLP